MERACGSLCDLQVGAASAEDEDRLLQGCEPAWRFPEPIVRLSRVLIPSKEDAMEGIHPHSWFPARSSTEGADVHQPGDPALGASPSQRQVPARFGQDVQSVHRRLDQLLRPVLSDAVAPDPTWERAEVKVLRATRHNPTCSLGAARPLLPDA